MCLILVIESTSNKHNSKFVEHYCMQNAFSFNLQVYLLLPNRKQEVSSDNIRVGIPYIYTVRLYRAFVIG